MWTLLRIALRNVLRNRRRTLITLAALVVGVGVMVSIRGLLNGLQNATVTGVVDGQSGAVQVHRKGYLANVLSSPLNLSVPADEAFLARLRAVPGVTAATARIQFPAMVAVGDETLFATAVALDPKHEFEVCPLRPLTLTPGTTFAADDGVVLTVELAKALGAGRGAEGAVLGPDVDGALSGEPMKVSGNLVLNNPGERKIAMVPLALAQKMLKLDGRATEIALSVEHLGRAGEVAERLRAELGPEYEVHTWDEVSTVLRDAAKNQDFLAGVVAGTFFLLMLLGVANTMLMSVLERTREVGTMMAVGVRRGRIVVLFLFEAVFLGALGGLLGGALGALLTWALNVRGIAFEMPTSPVPFTIRPVVTPQYLVTMVVVAALGAVVFGLYPAWRASRLRPVQALAGR